MSSKTVFVEAARAVATLVQNIAEDAWDRPGLGSWDVRGLVGHTGRALTTVVDYLAKPAEQVELESPVAYLCAVNRMDPVMHLGVAERGVQAGAELGDHPADAFVALVAAAEAAVRAAQGDPLVTTFAGGMRLSDYLETRVFELIVHGSDIASATLQPPVLPDEAVTMTVRLAAEAALLNGDGLRLARMITGRDGSSFSVF